MKINRRTTEHWVICHPIKQRARIEEQYAITVFLTTGSYWLLCVPRGKNDPRFCCTHTTSRGSNTTQRTAIQSATPLAKNLPSNSVPSHPPHKAANAPMQSMAGHFFLPHDAGQNFAGTASRPISRPSRSQKKERASITNLIS